MWHRHRLVARSVRGAWRTFCRPWSANRRMRAELRQLWGGDAKPFNDTKLLEDLGVSRVVGGPPGFTPEQVTEGLEKLGNEILSKF